jgi:dimethylhistidine N-methyltransferase
VNAHDSDIAEILSGLKRPQKMISPKYFYDERGSKLFEDITQLPEYYLTDAEMDIMTSHADEIAAKIGPEASLIEFGAGSGLKTRILLEYLHELAAYVPVDISEDHLLESAGQIRADFPHIEVLPVVADFTRPFDLPNPRIPPRRNIVYFPGSTIGNFERAVAEELLGVMYQEAGKDGALLIGVDLQKDPQIIDAAYNDSAGITAEFNLNMLRHLNEQFGTDFDVDAFTHDARYVPDEGRVRLSLVSGKPQDVRVGDETIRIEKGEDILTEYSHKYTLEGFAEMAAHAGFTVDTVWTDDNELFSVQYCVRD